MSDGGKGSAQRPVANRKTFEENWNAIFGEVDSGGGPDSGNDVAGSNVGDRPREKAGPQGSAEYKPGKPGT